MAFRTHVPHIKQIIRLSGQFGTRCGSLCSQQRRLISILSSNRRRPEICGKRTHTSSYSTSGYLRQQNDGIVRSPLREVEIPESPFMPHYIMEHWHKYTDKIALINSTTGAEMTYGQLQTQIARVGSALVRQSYGKGDVITIFSPNCPEFCVIHMAAACIGMTVSAVNPVYTSDELIHAMNLSDSKVLAFSHSLVDVVNAALPKCQTIKKSISFGTAGGNHQPLESLLEDDGKDFPENIDYDSKEDVILLPYSSGTTGLPKGVMLTSHNVIANMQQYGTPELLNPNDNDIFICELPLFHMFAQTTNLLMSFRFGITNIHMEKFNPIEYLDLVKKYRPTWLHVVPPIMLFLAKHPVVEKYDFSCVQNYLYAAAPMAPNIITDVQKRIMPHASPVQAYGLTELSPVSHLSPSFDRKPETVGVAVHNTEYKIRDIETDKLLPAYKDGEVCVRGPQVMKGYLKNDEATRQTIIDDWLYTGDIGYYDDDGYLIITDRLKELIKYKGLQVAPAELEDVLLKHPFVQDAAVIGKPDDAAGELPRAYVVLKPDVKATEQDIKDFVKEHAAPYKQLRGGVEFRAEIPKTASGKILRRILRDELRST